MVALPGLPPIVFSLAMAGAEAISIAIRAMIEILLVMFISW
jgi:hypothetical protein